ncbi:hypothetical protein DDP54_09730 [Cellulomonas sp. WB94]|uniref:hypothetical protein n=1 Tax=Cellulomonas sp. WB94 TaxID=2173174 RepID=UPI000D588882|nr:hypothetical protein [Cellulomonas sp. WB94]PVU83224.1 hypothetical protein DDP54_09730 [Cellulomonas sp. WB94]
MSTTGPDAPQGWGVPPRDASAAGQPASGAHALPAFEPAAPGVTEPAAPDDTRRRNMLIIGGIAAAVVIVGGIIAIIASQGGDDAAVLPTPTASTVLLPLPTATVAPVPRAATTAFASALPTTVLQYALATSAPEPTWVGAGAIEAYSESYSDGGTAQVVVLAGQWETPEAAAAYAQQLVAAIPAAAAPPAATASSTASAEATGAAPAGFPATGDVTAAGQKVGTFSLVDAGDGTGVAVWTNGASVFRVTAPIADLRNVYAAYPL